MWHLYKGYTCFDSFLFLFIFASHNLFAQAGFEPWSSW
jgi:hypothetical protein